MRQSVAGDLVACVTAGNHATMDSNKETPDKEHQNLAVEFSVRSSLRSAKTQRFFCYKVLYSFPFLPTSCNLALPKGTSWEKSGKFLKTQIMFVQMSNALNIELRQRPFPKHLINLTLHLLILEHIRERTTSMFFEEGINAVIKKKKMNTVNLVEHESTTPVRTHTPITSATIAVPTRGCSTKASSTWANPGFFDSGQCSTYFRRAMFGWKAG